MSFIIIASAIVTWVLIGSLATWISSARLERAIKDLEPMLDKDHDPDKLKKLRKNIRSETTNSIVAFFIALVISVFCAAKIIDTVGEIERQQSSLYYRHF